MALRSSRPSTQQGFSDFSFPLQLLEETTGNSPTNDSMVAPPTTKLTQKDQDNADEKAHRESLRFLVQSWMDSLQLISVITTFFVATEASLLVITIPSPADSPDLSVRGQLTNIGLLGALVVHAFAAIISFLAAFFLVRHKLVVAQEEEEEVENHMIGRDPPKPISLNDLEKAKRGSQTSSFAEDLGTDPARGRVGVNSTLSGNQIIRSTNPHLVHVGPFQRQPPTELLARCHSLCVSLSFLGFLFALVGAMSFAWDRLPRSIGIFISILTVLCLVTAILILIVPSTNTSHIYHKHKA